MIPHAVTVEVVELLEVVDIDHQQAHRLAGQRSAADGLMQGGIEPAPVEQAGQGVGDGFLTHAVKIAPQLLHLGHS